MAANEKTAREGGVTSPRARLLGAGSGARKALITVGLILIALALLSTDRNALQATLLGAGGGALIAALALGVLVTYRGSGVINIATGAIAMYMSYVFNSLNSQGELLVVGWGVHLGSPVAFLPALLITLAIAGLWGAAYYLLIFAPLRAASPVAKLVASVGLLLAVQSVILLHYGSQPVPVTAELTTKSIKLPDNLVLPQSQAILSAVVIVVAIALTLIYRYTRPGLATRAAAEDERHLTLIGRSPLMVSGGNWVFSSMVVALLAILTAPINGTVDPTTITLLVIPALAAALLGGFTSFGYAVLGGLTIGMLQALIAYLGTKSWYPTAAGSPIPGVAESIPFLIILVALFFQKGRVSSRGSLGDVRLPFAPIPRMVAPKLLACGAVAVAGFLLLDSAWRLAEINTLVGVAICLSLVILVGYVGQVSLAQMALAGFSGFATAKLATSAGIAFPIGPILGALAATVLGVLAAIPAIRARGVQLAIVTLAAGLAIQSFVFQNPLWSGGQQGAQLPPPSLLGLHFGPADPTSLGDGSIPNPWFGIFCVVVVLLLAAMTCSLRLSPWGRRMLAVRANERAAAAAGIPVNQTKILAFGISAFVAGIAGSLSGYRFGSVTPEYFGVFASLTFLAFTYMGGISSVTGAVVGGLLVTNGLAFTALDQWFGLSPTYAPLVGGLGLILTVIMNPNGISGTWRQILRRRQSRGKPSPGAPPPASRPEAATAEASPG
jgi:branched-chain amino acid transport system permease protein